MTSASFRRQTSSDSFNDALRALEAIGTDTWTAIGHLFPTFPAMATTHGVRMLKKSHWYCPGTHLGRVALGSTDAAHAILSEWQKLDPPRNLDLYSCQWLMSLPDPLQVPGCLVLDKCDSLRDLPTLLMIGESLMLDSCKGLMAIPDGLVLGKSLSAPGCTSLATLPNELKINGDLHLGRCSALHSLPQGLEVKGELNLYGCTSLHFLPGGLKVGDRIILSACPSWDGQIPMDAFIGGQLFTDAHPQGISLAQWRGLHPGGECP